MNRADTTSKLPTMFTPPRKLAEDFIASIDGGLLVVTENVSAASLAWLAEQVPDLKHPVAVVLASRLGPVAKQTGDEKLRAACDFLERRSVQLFRWMPAGVPAQDAVRGSVFIARRNGDYVMLAGTPRLMQEDLDDEFRLLVNVTDPREAERVLNDIDATMRGVVKDVADETSSDWRGRRQAPVEVNDPAPAVTTSHRTDDGFSYLFA